MPGIPGVFSRTPQEIAKIDSAIVGGKAEFWYLASPYSRYPEGREEACAKVARWAGYCMLKGVRVFSPITHCHPIAVHASIADGEGQQDFWMAADEAIFQHAKGMLIAPMIGWDASKGVLYEADRFKGWNKPVYLLRM